MSVAIFGDILVHLFFFWKICCTTLVIHNCSFAHCGQLTKLQEQNLCFLIGVFISSQILSPLPWGIMAVFLFFFLVFTSHYTKSFNFLVVLTSFIIFNYAIDAIFVPLEGFCYIHNILFFISPPCRFLPQHRATQVNHLSSVSSHWRTEFIYIQCCLLLLHDVIFRFHHPDKCCNYKPCLWTPTMWHAGIAEHWIEILTKCSLVYGLRTFLQSWCQFDGH